MLKKEKFSTPLFMVISISALILLLALFFVVKLSLARMYINNQLAVENDQINKIYLNEKYEDVEDPFLTKKPDLKDMLAGPIVSDNDPVFGDDKAPVSLIIFSDFQCSVCYKQETVFKKIVEKYKDKVKLIWKDYPDKNSSSASFQASLAGRCANEQSNFWDYHSLLFENKNELSKEKFIELAEQTGLDVNKFENCLTNQKYKQNIIDNTLEANALEINGVPFIYVNDKEVMGEIDYNDLEEIIEGELIN